MLIFFSVCSVIYALFYTAIICSNKKIEYVENIFSLNIDKMKEYDLAPEQEDLEDIQKGYTIEKIR
ncbi:hypothetical protein IKI14_02590 [bacterium]|nr:hypothetical protein [bacterium]